MTVKVVTYHALEPGIVLTALGAVHGNERCGAEAIGRLIADIDLGAVILKRGTLQLVPVTNPKAYLGRVRFVERNLNRYLYPKEERLRYEDRLDPILCGLLDRTDVLLDLHSYTSDGGPFIFLGGQNAEELRYARSLGVSDFVCGWTEAFGGGEADKESQGTTEYARAQGALAVTLECGNHESAAAPEIGYRAILLALAHLDMLDMESPAAPRPARDSSSAGQRLVRMKRVYRRDEGALLARQWKHFDRIAKSEPMATLANGEVLPAPEDGFIVLPKIKAGIGEEWFYFGTETAFAA